MNQQANWPLLKGCLTAPDDLDNGILHRHITPYPSSIIPFVILFGTLPLSVGDAQLCVGRCLLHIGIFGDRGYTIDRLALEHIAAFVCDSAPSAGLLVVLDPLHCREVVVVLLHSDHPWYIVECHSLETEVCVWLA
jgi:hypothetical protein